MAPLDPLKSLDPLKDSTNRVNRVVPSVSPDDRRDAIHLPPAAIIGAAPGQPAAPPVRDHSRLRLLLGISVLAAIVLGAAGLVLYRILTRDRGQSTVAGGVLTATPNGLYFRNATENIAFVAPADWSPFPTASAQIMVRGGGCSFGLLEQRTNLSVANFASAEAKDLKRRHPEATPIVAPRSIASRDGLAFTGAYTDAQGGPMSQTYILVDRGPNVITLIETATDPTCAQAFASLEDSLHL